MPRTAKPMLSVSLALTFACSGARNADTTRNLGACGRERCADGGQEASTPDEPAEAATREETTEDAAGTNASEAGPLLDAAADAPTSDTGADPALDAGLDADLEAASADVGLVEDATNDAEPALDAAGLGDSRVGQARTYPADCRTGEPYAALSPVAEGLPADGLKLWLRADKGVVLDGEGRVCGWDDQSGNRHDLYQDTPALRPSGRVSLAGQPAINLDQTQYLQRPDVLGIASASGRSFVAVYALDNAAARFGAVVQGQLDTNWAWIAIDDNTFQTVGNRYGCYVPTIPFDGQLTTTQTVRIRALLVDSLTPGQALSMRFRCRVDGANLTLSPRDRAGSLIADLAGANVTRVGWGAANRDDARIAEVLVYDRELGADELQQLEETLARRYGVTLAY